MSYKSQSKSWKVFHWLLVAMFAAVWGWFTWFVWWEDWMSPARVELPQGPFDAMFELFAPIIIGIILFFVYGMFREASEVGEETEEE